MDEVNAKGIVLRPVRPEDASFLARLYGDEQVRQFLGGPAQGRDFVAQALGALWYRVVMVDGAHAGAVSLTAHCDGGVEVSYQLMPVYWGRGIAQVAVGQALCHGGGQMGLAEVLAETQVANGASRRLLERLGFVPYRRLARYGAAQIVYGIRLGSACPDPDLQGS